MAAPTARRARRGCRRSDIRRSRVDGAAARAHRVDHRHAAGGDIVAVADAAGVAPADRPGRDRRRSWRTRSNSRCGAGDRPAWAGGRSRHGRGCGRRARPRRSRRPRRSCACARAWSSGVAGRRLTRSTALSGTTLLGPPPSIRAGLTLRPVALRLGEPQREVGGGEQGVAAVLGVAAGMGAAAVDEER